MTLSRRGVLLGLGAMAVVPARASGRRQLRSGIEFRVSPSGDDNNDGITAPKRTITAMVHELQSNWDMRGCTPRILCAPGTYESVAMKGGLVGAIEPLRIVGSTTRGACTIQGNSHAVYIDGARALIEGFTIKSPDMGLVATNQGFIQYRDIEFGQCGLAHVAAEKGGSTYALCLREDNKTKACYTISGKAECHLYVNGGARGILSDTVNGHGIRFMAPLRFLAFANVIQGGTLTAHTNVWSGPNPEGAAVWCRWNSVAAFANQLPGNQALNFVDASSTLV